MAWRLMRRTRDAAISRANGMPSRSSQILATTMSSPSRSAKPARDVRARSMNYTIKSHAQTIER
jgi:hypothetical protein